MKPLDRKLTRDLWRLRGQVTAIAFVVASGAALLVMALTTIEALEQTTSAYYERYRFADVFASLKRAPEHVAHDIAALPGVRNVQTRIVQVATLDVRGFREPVTGELISLPVHDSGALNALALRSGRMAAPERPDEVVVSEPFADAHGLKPGDGITAILRGRKRDLTIVGTVLSPEFVYAIAPGGLMPDDKRFGILWMSRKALEAAYDLDGAFNSVTLGLLRGADENAVIRRLDALLDRYGATGAVGRADQISNWFLQNEITQQKNMSHLLPTIFLAVAAFLTYMVIGRLIETERREIGLLKAFGYGDWEVGWHYAKMVLVIGALGVLLGAAIGAWLGHWNTQLYAQFYRFPFLLYRPGPSSFVIAGLVSLAAALGGSLIAVRRAVALPPAVAMLPPSPAAYQRTFLSRTTVARALDEPTRIIIRRLLRWPLRAFFASAGLAMSVAVLVMALQWLDAIDTLAETFFVRGQHQDATVSFHDLQPMATVESFKRLPGVLAVEPYRTVSARIGHGHLSRRQGIIGVPAGAVMSPIHDVKLGPIEAPPGGLLVSRKMADLLGVGVGDALWVEVLQGRRPRFELPVVRIFDTYIGTPVHMEMTALNRVMQDGRAISGVHLDIDARERQALLDKLKDLPNIAAILFRKAAIDQFYDTMGETMLIFAGFFVAFAATLSVGVTYNSARIALSERARELATLRVLGFGRWEISYILLGEIALLTWLAVPLGCLAGYALAWYLTSAFDTELFRVPLVILDRTYGVAALVLLGTTAMSAALVRRNLDRLDLVGVLKTRE